MFLLRPHHLLSLTCPGQLHIQIESLFPSSSSIRLQLCLLPSVCSSSSSGHRPDLVASSSCFNRGSRSGCFGFLLSLWLQISSSASSSSVCLWLCLLLFVCLSSTSSSTVRLPRCSNAFGHEWLDLEIWRTRPAKVTTAMDEGRGPRSGGWRKNRKRRSWRGCSSRSRATLEGVFHHPRLQALLVHGSEAPHSQIW